MKWLVCVLCLFPCLSSAISPTDVTAGVGVVAPQMQVPTMVKVVDMDDPMGASWKPASRVCIVYVSRAYIGELQWLMRGRSRGPMLEGLIAHELAHCLDMKAVSSELGILRAKQYYTNAATVLQSEILADIMAIMYWKQAYPKEADWLIRGLMDWRKSSGASDVLHYTYPALVQALPLIPARLSYETARQIRDDVKSR